MNEKSYIIKNSTDVVSYTLDTTEQGQKLIVQDGAVLEVVVLA